MIGIYSEHTTEEKVVRLVYSALIRSLSKAQVILLDDNDFFKSNNIGIYVLISPSDKTLAHIKNLNVKIILFGALPNKFLLSCKATETSFPDKSWAISPEATIYSYSESPAYVKYTKKAKDIFNIDWKRSFQRFDFMDEWNNLGYGSITDDDSEWSICQAIEIPEEYSLANACIGNDEVVSTYSALINVNVLWFNRKVGPIDSFEWHLVELFISSYQCDQKPCYPILVEIPQGYESAVTMRLDCDEEIESARYLWEEYKKREIPFSIAIHTTNLDNELNHSIVNEMHLLGESILSHTATHSPNWGGSYESAVIEANVSADKIYDLIGYKVRYAVAPFHQAPEYSLKALEDSNYSGCVGGIIKNDPEFLVFNGGLIANMSENFIGHSQQVMLHGDCILEEENSIRIYQESFDLSFQTNTIFGYLDHPFSDRYQYGWKDEAQRAEVHVNLIQYIKEKTNDSVLFMSENDALDFIYDKSHMELYLVDEDIKLTYLLKYEARQEKLPKVLFKNELFDKEL